MGTLAGCTVLVVEDFDDTRFLMKLSLERQGYRVLEAVDGQRAVEVAASERPDLILMDLSLPVLDGLSATRRIRENSELRGVPIVAVTAHGEAQYRDKAMAAGCDDFFNKPIDFHKLEGVMRRHLTPH